MLNNNVVVKVCAQTVNGEPGAQLEAVSQKTLYILPAVLGWHLLTCNILPADLRWHLLTCNILPPDVRWHLPGLPNAPKNKNDQAKIQIQTEIIETTMKSASPQTKISYSIQNIQILSKNHEMVWKSPETNSKCAATQLYHHKCHNCHKYHKIRQCP